MTIHVDYRPDGLIEISCGEERVLIAPTGRPPQASTSPGPASPRPILPDPDDLDSPPIGPKVMFMIADPARIDFPMPKLRVGNYGLAEIIAKEISEGQPRKRINIQMLPHTSFDYKLTSDLAKAVNTEVRLWVPRGKQDE